MDQFNLKQLILKTVCFFDVLGYPLTTWEVTKWLEAPADWSAVFRELETIKAAGLLESKFGFYFLPGREILVEERRIRYILAERKFKRVMKFANLFKYFPFIQAIAIYSSLSFANSRRQGDLDFFVVTAPGRLWSARFFINLFLKIFRLRPDVRGSQDKICVSFLVAADQLDLSVILDQPVDWYYTYGTGQFIFVYDQNKIADRFFGSNSWLKVRLPQWFPYQTNDRRRAVLVWPALKRLGERFVALMPEAAYQRFQEMILPETLKKMRNQDKRVIINDKIIKLHDNDKRKKFNLAFNQAWDQLLKK